MSRTKLHKQKGFWKNNKHERVKKNSILEFYYFRRWSEFSYFAENRIELEEKILNKDFKDQLNDNI